VKAVRGSEITGKNLSNRWVLAGSETVMVIRMVNHAEEVMDAELGQSGIEKLVPERG